ncbi:hypothetical protein Dda_4787 [Drechslerella dactyloides]|uniref:Uncharacterized protein n=1 Tax=Drechslerella dactyloides TaxID=74499 RepID=A0AAD6NI90_DREDA|nr:hypothetical protein Dda_4787 [Drechslerella dactyloides]
MNGKPASRVTITFKNTTSWPLTLSDMRNQSGASWSSYLPQVIDPQSKGTWSETMNAATDDVHGYGEYSLCDGNNILEIKLLWLGPNPSGGRSASYKWEMEGDETGKYKITNKVDKGADSNVTFTLAARPQCLEAFSDSHIIGGHLPCAAYIKGLPGSLYLSLSCPDIQFEIKTRTVIDDIYFSNIMGKFDNPFAPAGDRHPWERDMALQHLQSIPEFQVGWFDRGIIRAVLLASPNLALLQKIAKFDYGTLKDLASLSLFALKSITSYYQHPRCVYMPPEDLQYFEDLYDQLDDKLGLKITSSLGIEQVFPVAPRGENPACPQRHLATSQQRQECRCLVTGSNVCRVGRPDDLWRTCYIFPNELLDPTPLSAVVWRFVVVFYGEAIRDTLVNEIFSEEHGVHSTANKLVLEEALHYRFNAGQIRIVPRVEPDGDLRGRYMDVEYRDCNPRIFDRPLFTFGTYRPKDPGKQHEYDSDGFPSCRILQEEAREVGGEEIIRATTRFPDTLPLPSATLLFWHASIFDLLADPGVRFRRPKPSSGHRDFGRTEDVHPTAADKEQANQFFRGVHQWRELRRNINERDYRCHKRGYYYGESRR